MRLLCAVAAAALAASSMGCQAIHNRGGQPSHLTTLAKAPRPNIQRVAFGGTYDNACGCDTCADACGCGDYCGCDDGCCDDGCCGSTGCGSCDGCCNGNSCINGIVSGILDCHGNCLGGADAAYNFTPGPPAAQTAYPYYTVRGPRDFLARNPRSIGPTGAYGSR